MRPPFNNFQPQGRPHRPQQQQQNNRYSNQHQHNGYQNPMQPNQLGMMNPLMMGNPMMGHMNNPMPMPNMPIHPQLFNNNLSNMPQHQQQQHNQFAMPNHINQLLPNLLGHLQYAVANNNLMGQSMPLVQPNVFQPSPSQPQPNSFNSRPYRPVLNPHQNHQSGPPGFSEPRPQGQFGGVVDNTNGSGPRGNDFRNKFTKHQKFNGPGQKFQRSQFHQGDNRKRKSGFNKNHMGKGRYNKRTSELDESIDQENQEKKRRIFALVYTPKEIQQWREARRKNFPSKLNVEKKLKKNNTDINLDEEAITRRQQLKEVLAKQAELGVEVAEVPSHYLSNTAEGNINIHDNRRHGGRHQDNRHDNRRHGGRDKFDKKTRFEDKNPSQEFALPTRQPTLLEKLLSADIKRDKIQLLQVFRCMVMNSFLKEFPEEPLKLPVVMVEETGCEHVREEDLLAEVLGDDIIDDDDVDDEEDVD